MGSVTWPRLLGHLLLPGDPDARPQFACGLVLSGGTSRRAVATLIRERPLPARPACLRCKRSLAWRFIATRGWAGEAPELRWARLARLPWSFRLWAAGRWAWAGPLLDLAPETRGLFACDS